MSIGSWGRNVRFGGDERVVVVDRLSERLDNTPVVVVVTERTQRAKPDVLSLALASGSA